MTLIVEDGTIVENANSYISLVEFKAYHDARGNTYSDDDTILEQSIIKAMDYISQRWGRRFKGSIEDTTQELDFPRIRLYDRNGLLVAGIPSNLKKATSEYALRASSAALMPDPLTNELGLSVKRTREKIGPIEEETEYNPGTAVILKAYPKADKFLVDYVAGGSGVIRG